MNKQIIFDSDMCTLGLEDSQDELIQISNPTKRLLLLLIAHKGEAIKREVIFKKVWDDYGMVSSNNNLNQCVSKLRKIMKNLGMDEEVIVTVPKIGFMLHQQVDVEKCSEPVDVIEDVPSETETAYFADGRLLNGKIAERSTGEVSRWRTMKTGILNQLVLFFSVMALGGAAGFWFASKPVERNEIYIGNAGSCKVMMSEQALNSITNPDVKKGVMDFAIKLNPVCKSNEYVLIIKSSSFKTYSSNLSRLYFMRCGIMSEGKAEICWGLLPPR
ncbi:winged helix-turn-helix domain-containing protein [Enterobacter sp. K16B]|uniref:winged helix-turn-helix domain-containing protein n=1 Tax=Enterobacter TaxID=547 RepID=UPI001CD98DDC|nr:MULTISPECIES: winged helix-turn-helix domain-containing protein [Enterobacter]MCA2024384.1 winged helix-turn-helix domain-containing protein [Enterobacter sp. K16B]